MPSTCARVSAPALRLLLRLLAPRRGSGRLVRLFAGGLDGGFLGLCGRRRRPRGNQKLKDAAEHVANKHNERRAGQLPRGDADAAHGASREGYDPFRVVGEPAVRQPEHGLLGVPEGQGVLWCSGDEESDGAEVLVEASTRGFQAFLCRAY